MIYVNPVVGRTGLGNMLFSWARAEIFRKHINGKMLAPPWTNTFRIGPWLRREKFKRYYFSEFVNSEYIGGMRRWLLLRLLRHLPEKEVACDASLSNPNCIVDFEGMEGLFLPLADHQAYVKERLMAITAPQILESIEIGQYDKFLGVHIRRGDFIAANWDISDRWYVNAITAALTDLETKDIEIRVFSDASQKKLRYISDEFPNVVFMPKAPAMQDLLMLSTAEALVCTSRSSFSMWAVFLGQIPSYWSVKPQSMGKVTDDLVRIID